MNLTHLTNEQLNDAWIEAQKIYAASGIYRGDCLRIALQKLPDSPIMNTTNDNEPRTGSAVWIPHTTGTCPVPPETVVEVKTSNGRVLTGTAEDVGWALSNAPGGSGWNVTAYRIINPAPTKDTPTPPPGFHIATEAERKCLPEGSLRWESNPGEWEPSCLSRHDLTSDLHIPYACPDTPTEELVTEAEVKQLGKGLRWCAKFEAHDIVVMVNRRHTSIVAPLRKEITRLRADYSKECEIGKKLFEECTRLRAELAESRLEDCRKQVKLLAEKPEERIVEECWDIYAAGTSQTISFRAAIAHALAHARAKGAAESKLVQTRPDNEQSRLEDAESDRQLAEELSTEGWSLAQPPFGQLHNPDNLTAEQVGDPSVWRLLTVEEREERYKSGAYYDADVWMHGVWHSKWNGGLAHRTYRIRLADCPWPQSPTPEKEPEWVPLGPEDIVPGCVIRYKDRPGFDWRYCEPIMSGASLVSQTVEHKVGWQELFEKWEISRDLGKTWAACKKLKEERA